MIEIFCPLCQAQFPTSRPVAPGTNVRCPECGSRFTVPAAAAAPPEPVAAPAAVPGTASSLPDWVSANLAVGVTAPPPVVRPEAPRSAPPAPVLAAPPPEPVVQTVLPTEPAPPLRLTSVAQPAMATSTVPAASNRVVAMALIAAGATLFVVIGGGFAVYGYLVLSDRGKAPTPAVRPGGIPATPVVGDPTRPLPGGTTPMDDISPEVLAGVQRLGTNWVTAQAPRPLTDNVKKGLAYLASQQQADGGWGQGGGWRIGTTGRPQPSNTSKPSDGANTCIATLALLRGGSTPNQGEYASNVARALDYILTQVEKSESHSPFVTEARGTQVQAKIGTFADTFLAAVLLAELKGRVGDPERERRLAAALDKVIAKMECHQRPDGTFTGNQGWASILTQGLASKALNRARQAGAPVSDTALERAQMFAQKNVNARTGQFSVDATAAGIALYSAGANLSALQDAVNTYKAQEKAVREQASSGPTENLRVLARNKLLLFEQAAENQKAATSIVVKNLDNRRFIAGFGTNGGEEFLSYMNIGEALAVCGGADWEGWTRAMDDNLGRVQNADGSWAGHHCITGRTFCTAAAVLSLLTDRTPVPVAVKLAQR